jgi:hypothetical protein
MPPTDHSGEDRRGPDPARAVPTPDQTASWHTYVHVDRWKAGFQGIAEAACLFLR